MLCWCAIAVGGCSLLPWKSNEPTTVTFTDKVWRVAEPSDVPAGAFYVFLSDGTLLIKAADSLPLLGTWGIEAGAFTMVEEGVAYQVDILGLTDDEFFIRSRSPGPPVKIRLVPADAPLTLPTPGETK